MELLTQIAFLILFAVAIYFWHRSEMVKINQILRRARLRHHLEISAANQRIGELETQVENLSRKSGGDKDDAKTSIKSKNPAEAMEDRYADQLSTLVSVNGLPTKVSK